LLCWVAFIGVNAEFYVISYKCEYPLVCRNDQELPIHHQTGLILPFQRTTEVIGLGIGEGTCLYPMKGPLLQFGFRGREFQITQ